MNIFDYIVLSCLAIAVIRALIWTYRSGKKGKKCVGGCGCCSYNRNCAGK